MKIRGVLFDKDGTLLDYWKTWVPINRTIAMFAAGEMQGWRHSCCGRAGMIPRPTGWRPERCWRPAAMTRSPRLLLTF